MKKIAHDICTEFRLGYVMQFNVYVCSYYLSLCLIAYNRAIVRWYKRKIKRILKNDQEIILIHWKYIET